MIALLAVTGAAQQPQAFVLGKPIHVSEVAAGTITRDQWKVAAYRIQSALMEQYGKSHGLEPTGAETAAVRARMRRASGSRVEKIISESSERLRQDLIHAGIDEQAAAQQSRDFAAGEAAKDQQFALALIRLWKVGGALFAQYGGGRVRLSAFGFHEPIDAMERFLIEEERRGNFSIPDPQTRAILWAIFQDKSGGDGMLSGAKAEAVYAKPPWEQPM